jgi:hypothetical protein
MVGENVTHASFQGPAKAFDFHVSWEYPITDGHDGAFQSGSSAVINRVRPR